MKTLRWFLLLGILWAGIFATLAALPVAGQVQVTTQAVTAAPEPQVLVPSTPPSAPTNIPVPTPSTGLQPQIQNNGGVSFQPVPFGPTPGGTPGSIMRIPDTVKLASPTPTPIQIDPKTPAKDLLPTPPKSTRRLGPLLGDDLSKVPEVAFGAEVKKDQANGALQEIAVQVARINHLNSKQQDGFLQALLAERRDLQGLPFAMGDACRTRGERSKHFNTAVAVLRQSIQQHGLNQRAQSELFWQEYRRASILGVLNKSSVDREQNEHVILTSMAALMQVLMPESADVRLGLVNYLAAISHPEATRNLARMAIFSEEVEVRNAAVEALRVRRERDYTEVLTQGLRYPWPAVARRTAEAVVKLERQDLIPQLLDVLESDDPRAPQTRMVDGKQTLVARELVKLNHHRNCLMCHSPGNDGKVAAETLTAGVPIPGEPMLPPQQGYQNSNPNILVRIDVTYLRQDFSRMQAVADAAPWPEMQRFDYLVQTRTLCDEEAASYRVKLAAREPGQLSPYHRAALVALRELTGKDTEPNAAAWRKLLSKEAQARR